MPDFLNIIGKIVDVVAGKIYPGMICIKEGKIASISLTKEEDCSHFLIPGMVDSHVHIESSLLPPSQFARLAVVHGVIAALADPHEIANVLGINGVRYMIENGQSVPFKFYFGVPSCVPATTFETAGGQIGIKETEELLREPAIKYLGEMMNFPGVINNDPAVCSKIALAKRYGKLIDGHAPGLIGDSLTQYIDAGISTDHECLNIDEAEEKLSLGMKILIRDGSASKYLEKFICLLDRHKDQLMLCSDDIHPDELVDGYLNETCRRAIALGYDPIDVIRMATLNPAKHYGLNVGLLQIGDDADIAVIDSLENFRVLQTYIKGQLVAEGGKSLIYPKQAKPLNNFVSSLKQPNDFLIPKMGKFVRIIDVKDGEIFTRHLIYETPENGPYLNADTEQDILKIAVVNRYHKAPPALGMVKGFGLKQKSIASSVAHDSHNIVAVGTNDKDMTSAVNIIMESKGGLAAVVGNFTEFLPLPIAGIMTDLDAHTAAKKYSKLNAIASSFGSYLSAPFMTLSFMALLVIPQLKLSDQGLFDGEKMRFVNLFADSKMDCHE